MNVLIIENETYLAQSIASKLSDGGNICMVTSSIEEAMNKTDFDILLLSTNAVGQDYKGLIEKYRDSIVILMVSYVSEDTVSIPLKLGARDYIIKPFIMDELIRKIEHYKNYKKLIEDIKFFNRYFEFIEHELKTPETSNYRPPLIIKASNQRSADVYAMKYAVEKNIRFNFVNLKKISWNAYNFESDKIYYVSSCEDLRKNELKEFFEFITSRKIIASIVSVGAISFPQVIDITSISNSLEVGSDILSIRDYEKLVIAKFEGRYPDVELAKRLGMSRKSLWEKRKKYGITRKK